MHPKQKQWPQNDQMGGDFLVDLGNIRNPCNPIHTLYGIGEFYCRNKD
jgi:hypothetical protein